MRLVLAAGHVVIDLEVKRRPTPVAQQPPTPAAEQPPTPAPAKHPLGFQRNPPAGSSEKEAGT